MPVRRGGKQRIKLWRAWRLITLSLLYFKACPSPLLSGGWAGHLASQKPHTAPAVSSQAGPLALSGAPPHPCKQLWIWVSAPPCLEGPHSTTVTPWPGASSLGIASVLPEAMEMLWSMFVFLLVFQKRRTLSLLRLSGFFQVILWFLGCISRGQRMRIALQCAEASSCFSAPSQGEECELMMGMWTREQVQNWEVSHIWVLHQALLFLSTSLRYGMWNWRKPVSWWIKRRCPE